MIEFAYRARDERGQEHRGALTAPDEASARAQLTVRGLVVLELTAAATPAEPALSAFRRWRRRGNTLRLEAVLELTRELHALLASGVPLERALAWLEPALQNTPVASLITQAHAAVKSGAQLSQALAPFTAQLGEFYLALVRAGERSGELTAALADLTQELERRLATRRALASALTYPLVLVVVALLSLALILGFVVPQFRELFSDLGDALPALTRTVVAAGDAFAAHWRWVLPATFALLAAAEAWRQSSAGRARWDRWLLRAPLIAPVVRGMMLARYLRVFGLTLARGVPLLASAQLAHATLTNRALAQRLAPVADALRQGRRLSTVLAEALPEERTLARVLALGEETGRLAEVLVEQAQRHHERATLRLQRLLQLVEPAIVLTLGAFVALIVIAVLLGILSVNQLV